MESKTQKKRAAARARRERVGDLFIKNVNKIGLASVLWSRHGSPLVDDYVTDTEDRTILDEEHPMAEDSLGRGDSPVRRLALSLQGMIETEAAALLAREVLFSGLDEARCEDFDEVVAYLEAQKRQIFERLADLAGTTMGRACAWRSAVDEAVTRAHADFIYTIDRAICDTRKAQAMGCNNVYGN